MKMNKKLGAALALSMVVGATTTVPVMAETTKAETTKDTTKSAADLATDLRKEANAAKAEYDKAAAKSEKANQALETAQKDAEKAEKEYNAAKTAKEKFETWQDKSNDLIKAHNKREALEPKYHVGPVWNYKSAIEELEQLNDQLEDANDTITAEGIQSQITNINNTITELLKKDVVEIYVNAVDAEKVAAKEEDTAHDAYLDAKKAYGKSFDSKNEWKKEVKKLEKALNTANADLTNKKTDAETAKKDAAALKAVYDKAEQKAVAAEKAEEALRLAEEARKAAKAKPAKVTLKKVKSKKRRTVKVTWKKAKAAKKYQVAYRRKKYAKKWTKWTYKVVKGTSYTNKKLRSRRTYQFKVRGLNGKIKGKFSKMKKVRVK